MPYYAGVWLVTAVVCVSKVLFLPTSIPEEMESKIFLIICSQRKSFVPGALSSFFLYLTSEFIIDVRRVVKLLPNVDTDQHEWGRNLLRNLPI